MTDVELPLGQLRIHFGARRRDRRVVVAQGMPGGSRTTLQDHHAGAPGASRLRARRDHLDGLRGLLPDRRRLPLRSGAGHPDDLPRFGAEQHRHVHPRDHPGRSDPLSAALRAVPQPRPGHDAGYRRRFEDGRRDEVIAYVGRKYGQDHVAQIITFGTMLARAAVDVGRVLGLALR